MPPARKQDEQQEEESYEDRWDRIEGERRAESAAIAGIASGGSAGEELIEGSDAREAKLKRSGSVES